jgi:hypothetical protein
MVVASIHRVAIGLHQRHLALNDSIAIIADLSSLAVRGRGDLHLAGQPRVLPVAEHHHIKHHSSDRLIAHPSITIITPVIAIVYANRKIGGSRFHYDMNMIS